MTLTLGLSLDALKSFGVSAGTGGGGAFTPALKFNDGRDSQYLYALLEEWVM